MIRKRVALMGLLFPKQCGDVFFEFFESDKKDFINPKSKPRPSGASAIKRASKKRRSVKRGKK